MEATAVCRTRQKAGWMLNGLPLPFWAEKAYLIANSVFSQIENELDEDGDENASEFGKLKGAGDSGAFSLIHQTLYEVKGRIKTDEDEDGY